MSTNSGGSNVRTSDSLTLEPTGILGNDDHAATFLRVRGQRGDRTLDIETADMLRVGPAIRWSNTPEFEAFE